MLFNSLNFIIFFVVVTALYYLLPYRSGIVMLFIASYVFYMAWNPKLVWLILFVTLLNFAGGYLIDHPTFVSWRKFILGSCILISFGLLFVFKYADMMVLTLQQLLHWAGVNLSLEAPHIVLPMGISFYTFQAVAYTIDVYRRQLPASKSVLKFSLFIAFFPQLVAGPIERSKNLINQFNVKNRFDMDNVLAGLELMAVGFFKKMVIADRAAIGVNTVFNNPEAYSGLYFIVAALFFTVQIYCDFSGYTDIARGAARVLGFKLMLNFKRPYGAKNLQMFWRRWHISLSTWFMDYVNIPLGGNRRGKLIKYRNLFITFLVSGLWHGAAYTFVLWGMLHGGLMVIEDILRGHYRQLKARFQLLNHGDTLLAPLTTLATFVFVCAAFVVFRANSIHDVGYIFSHLTDHIELWHTKQYLYEMVTSLGWSLYELMLLLLAIVVLFVSEALAGDTISDTIRRKGAVIEVLYFSAMVLFILVAGVFYNAGAFIYFQF